MTTLEAGWKPAAPTLDISWRGTLPQSRRIFSLPTGRHAADAATAWRRRDSGL